MGNDDDIGDLDDGDIVDELPADLDITEADSDYTLPNNNRRRIPATMYLLIGAAAGLVWWRFDDSSAVVNDGIAWAAVGLGLFGVYGLVTGWTVRIDESEALVAASRVAGFTVGHASAQMVWRGWLSRPTWRVLVYSAENPPAERSIALVDAVGGDVVEWFSEANPEQWADVEGPTAPPTSSSSTIQ